MGLLDFFKRGKRIAEAEANSALDAAEDPVKMTEQGIRELEGHLGKLTKAQAQVASAKVLRTKNQTKLEESAKEWKEKAAGLLKIADDPGTKAAKKTKSESLAVEALNRYENAMEEAGKEKAAAAKFDKQLEQMSDKIKSTKESIKALKSDISNLKVRATTAKAMKEVNKDLSDVGNTDSVTSMMERMRAKVAADEAEAEGLEEIGDLNKDVSDEMDEILAGESTSKNEDLLASMRAEMAKK